MSASTATGAVAVWIGGSSVLLPSLLAGSQQTVLTVFLPIPVVASLALSLDSRLAAFEAAAFRSPRTHEVLFVATFLAACLAASAAVASTVAVATFRNAAFLTGLMLAARPWARQASVIAPVLWIAVVVFFSRTPYPDPDWWTVLPEPVSAPHAALTAVATLATGLTVHLCARPELP
ncbi:hypothetical protein [Streptomyces sp. NPDC058308]|uniref:hypothetical protein n=1 Tax=Streptomyces sp. NPDC058308 TaxID=3346440 RepID=UPI0036E5FE8C